MSRSGSFATRLAIFAKAIQTRLTRELFRGSLSDSDELIAYFADKYGVDVGGLQTLPFYLRGLKPRFHQLLKENRAYRARYGELPK